MRKFSAFIRQLYAPVEAFFDRNKFLGQIIGSLIVAAILGVISLFYLTWTSNRARPNVAVGNEIAVAVIPADPIERPPTPTPTVTVPPPPDLSIKPLANRCIDQASYNTIAAMIESKARAVGQKCFVVFTPSPIEAMNCSDTAGLLRFDVRYSITGSRGERSDFRFCYAKRGPLDAGGIRYRLLAGDFKDQCAAKNLVFEDDEMACR